MSVHVSLILTTFLLCFLAVSMKLSNSKYACVKIKTVQCVAAKTETFLKCYKIVAELVLNDQNGRFLTDQQ